MHQQLNPHSTGVSGSTDAVQPPTLQSNVHGPGTALSGLRAYASEQEGHPPQPSLPWHPRGVSSSSTPRRKIKGPRETSPPGQNPILEQCSKIGGIAPKPLSPSHWLPAPGCSGLGRRSHSSADLPLPPPPPPPPGPLGFQKSRKSKRGEEKSSSLLNRGQGWMCPASQRARPGKQHEGLHNRQPALRPCGRLPRGSALSPPPK